MPARWRVAKLLKIKKENKARPRSLGVNWHNRYAMQVMPVDLELEGRVAEEIETRRPRSPTIQELGLTFNNMKHIELFRNVLVKIEMYWTTRRDAYYLVRYNYAGKYVQVSGSFKSAERAKEAYCNLDTVLWKHKRRLA